MKATAADTLRWAIPFFSSWLVLGCKPHVDKFEADLHQVCPGSEVTLSWKVKGFARLTIEPGSARGERVARSGSHKLRPTAPTVATLTVRRSLKSTAPQRSIDVWQHGAAPKLLSVSLADAAARPSCSDGMVRAVLRLRRFDPSMRAGLISAHPLVDRTYSLEHAGIRTQLAPGQQTDLFADTPLGDDWNFETPLAAGETCDDASLPANFSVDAEVRCQGAQP